MRFRTNALVPLLLAVAGVVAGADDPKKPQFVVKPPEMPKASKPTDVVPTHFFMPDLGMYGGLTLSADGSVLGVQALVKLAPREVKPAYFSCDTGKPFGKQLDTGFGGLIVAGNKFNLFKQPTTSGTDVVRREFETGKDAVVGTLPEGVEFFRASPDGKRVAYVHAGKIHCLKLTTGGDEFPELKSDKPVLEISRFFADGKKLASLHDGAVKIWDVEKGSELEEIKFDGKKSDKKVIDVSPDGRTVILQGPGYSDWVLDADTKKPAEWKSPPKYAMPLTPLSGGRVCFEQWEDKTDESFLAVCDAATGERKYRLLFPVLKRYDNITIQASADGKRVAVCHTSLNTARQFLAVWDLPAK